jgi:hypothetical protein
VIRGCPGTAAVDERSRGKEQQSRNMLSNNSKVIVTLAAISCEVNKVVGSAHACVARARPIVGLT